jgi:hypothetical protein
VKQPTSMKLVERGLSPVLGKSYVVYAHKPLVADLSAPEPVPPDSGVVQPSGAAPRLATRSLAEQRA